jgi:hypothetical protein
MPIQSIKSGTLSRSTAVGNAIILPGDFESIATTTVGAGGAANVEFTSIPGTYTHLQIRYLGKASGTGGSENPWLRFNSDTGNNYAAHRLMGNGASASADAFHGVSHIRAGFVPDSASGVANIFGATTIDILDYTNTNKTKTVRVFTGADQNGSGTITFSSGLWNSTSAITSLTLLNIGFNTHTSPYTE